MMKLSGTRPPTDAGAMWSAVNTGLPNLNVQVLAIDPAVPSTVFVDGVE